MKTLRFRLAVATSCAALFGLLAGGGTLGACGADSVAEDGEDASSLEGGPRRDGGGRDGSSVDDEDANAPPPPESFCARMKDYSDACNLPLECGTGFDTWCEQNTTSADSAAYRRGYVKCATEGNCKTEDRRDCMFRSYATASQSTSQKALVQAYCQTCEPANVAACTSRIVTYDSAAGPTPETAFIAVWELSDAVVDKIRTSCTGSSIDAGSPVICADAFDKCAGNFYIDALVNCP